MISQQQQISQIKIAIILNKVNDSYCIANDPFKNILPLIS